jgi:hypothetical protein
MRGEQPVAHEVRDADDALYRVGRAFELPGLQPADHGRGGREGAAQALQEARRTVAIGRLAQLVEDVLRAAAHAQDVLLPGAREPDGQVVLLVGEPPVRGHGEPEVLERAAQRRPAQLHGRDPGRSLAFGAAAEEADLVPGLGQGLGQAQGEALGPSVEAEARHDDGDSGLRHGHVLRMLFCGGILV